MQIGNFRILIRHLGRLPAKDGKSLLFVERLCLSVAEGGRFLCVPHDVVLRALLFDLLVDTETRASPALFGVQQVAFLAVAC